MGRTGKKQSRSNDHHHISQNPKWAHRSIVAGKFKIHPATEGGGAVPMRSKDLAECSPVGCLNELPSQGAQVAQVEAPDEASYCSSSQISYFHRSVMRGCTASPYQNRPQRHAAKPLELWNSGGKDCRGGLRKRHDYGGCWHTQGHDKLVMNAAKIAFES